MPEDLPPIPDFRVGSFVRFVYTEVAGSHVREAQAQGTVAQVLPDGRAEVRAADGRRHRISPHQVIDVLAY